MSHFDRYASMKPVYTSIAEYDRSFKSMAKRKLLDDAKTAIAWAHPDKESMGYSISELTSIIRRLVEYIEAQ